MYRSVCGRSFTTLTTGNYSHSLNNSLINKSVAGPLNLYQKRHASIRILCLEDILNRGGEMQINLSVSR